ncbi:MAG: MinD/ParA family protein [bacterium]|nr:MinD/ParA family protein [bacterium]
MAVSSIQKKEVLSPSGKKGIESLNKTIWSVAGGKGGTGKTIISANIGVGMAVLGYKVILIDADLGVPNLHNYLGIKRPQMTIDDFLVKKVDNLSDVIIPTPIDRLKFISGGTSLVGIANLQYARKQKLLRHINKLNADIIVVDLGAGIAHNTIDFFNLSSRGIVITNPEPNANQDAYFFLKNAAYRRVKNYTKANNEFKNTFEAYINSNGNGTFDFQKFYDFLPDHSPVVHREFNDYMNAFKPRLIMNKIRKIGQKKEAQWFLNLVQKFMNIDMDYVGGLKFDSKIMESSEKSFPYLCRFPKSSNSKNMFEILDTLNSVDMKHHEVKSFKEFRKRLKDYQKNWK